MDFSMYYWTYKKNVGDYFSCWLMDRYYGKEGMYHRSEQNVDVVCTGSILEHPSICEDTLVCGSGWHNDNLNSIFRGKESNILGVRGKLTKEKLCPKKNVCLGDPGLLISYYYQPKVQKKYNYGVICHWRDDEYFTKKYGDTGLKIIHTNTYDVDQFAREINECKFIFSTSLHGLIFAHAYGIPAVHVEKTKLESRDNFKFKDYYSVLDCDYTKIKYDDSIRFVNEFRKIDDFSKYCPSKERVEQIQKNLLTMMDEMNSRLIAKYQLIANTKICLCGIAKCENNYIREWVEHHKALGFDKIYLYDNNDVDGEHFEDVIGDYIKSNYVELIDVRGKSNQQIKCYNEFYHTIAKNYKWVAYFDIDEFLNINGSLGIKKFVLQKKFNNYDAIAFNWKYFDDNNIAKSNNNFSVKKRFTREFKEKDWIYAQHCFSKRIIRTNNDSIIINSSHGPIEKAQMNEYNTEKSNHINVCNVEGEKIFNQLNFSNYSHKSAYLAHYRFKTISEYINNKMKRGYPTLYKNSGKDMNLDDFFALNVITEEKLSTAAYLLGIDVNDLRTKYLNIKKEERKDPSKIKKDNWQRIM